MEKLADWDEAWRYGYFDADEASEYQCMQRNHERLRAFHVQHQQRLGGHFYITVVPRTLDLLSCSLRCLPSTTKLFLILNGLDEWEREHVRRRYPHLPACELETEGTSILYDRVLDMLLETNSVDFGILDQDCFVLDPSLLTRLRMRRNDFAISPFVTHNRAASIAFPRTYFLFFKVKTLQSLRNQYRLSCKRCWTIPANIVQQLQALGFGYQNFPHDSMDYFDNFQLLWGIAMANGFTFLQPRQLRRWSRIRGRRFRVVHVGAGHNYLTDEWRDQMPARLAAYSELSQLDQEKLRAAAFCHYAHLVILEHSDDDELRQRYLPFFGNYEDSSGVLQQFGSVISGPSREKMEVLVQHLRRIGTSRG
ncbi:MAG: hypothetical protein AAF581_13105 [Planctomycetota bacterium]